MIKIWIFREAGEDILGSGKSLNIVTEVVEFAAYTMLSKGDQFGWSIKKSSENTNWNVGRKSLFLLCNVIFPLEP